MKLLQAIVTSSIETLESRQGLGLVECSCTMPDPIKKQARDWGYYSNADGDPIFSFRHIEDPDGKWAVMNRTVPATDFTGRTSYVSHTIALRLTDLKLWMDQHPGRIISPFEFMLGFEWKDKWVGKPRWIKEDEDEEICWDISSYLLKAPIPLECSASAPLLAFDYPRGSSPQAKLLTWKTGKLKSADMLCLFHQAWIALDPWRGENKYRDHLDEPDSSLADAWDCTFTTNLRNERPDPYQWVVLTGESPGNIETLDITEWQSLDDSIITQRIGEPIGSLLVARSKNPEEWATEGICRLLGELRQIQDAKIEECRTELRATIEEIFSKLDRACIEHKEPAEGFDTALQMIDCENVLKDRLEYINKSKSEFGNAINKAEYTTNATNEEYTRKHRSMTGLLKSAESGTNQPCFDKLIVSDIQQYRSDIRILEERFRATVLYYAVSKIASELSKASEEKGKQIATHAEELRGKDKIIDALYRKPTITNSRPTLWRQTHAPAQSQYSWQLLTIMGIVALALGVFLGCVYHDGICSTLKIDKSQSERTDRR